MRGHWRHGVGDRRTLVFYQLVCLAFYHLYVLRKKLKSTILKNILPPVPVVIRISRKRSLYTQHGKARLLPGAVWTPSTQEQCPLGCRRGAVERNYQNISSVANSKYYFLKFLFHSLCEYVASLGGHMYSG